MSFENRYMMRQTISLFTTVFAANAALVLSSGALAQEVAPALANPVAQEVHFPAMPATPALVTEVLAAIAFEVAAPYEHNMRKDRMMVTRGHVLVLRAPSALLVARQVAEPVLLVGAQTAERINRGFTAGKDSGVLIVLVIRASLCIALLLNPSGLTLGFGQLFALSPRQRASAFQHLYCAVSHLPSEFVASGSVRVVRVIASCLPRVVT